jgi:hypothetical protein
MTPALVEGDDPSRHCRHVEIYNFWVAFSALEALIQFNLILRYFSVLSQMRFYLQRNNIKIKIKHGYKFRPHVSVLEQLFPVKIAAPH